MKNRFKIGCNFDRNLLGKILDLNNRYDSSIVEMYGCSSKDSDLTARPKFRLPEISDSEVENFIKDLKSIGIDFSYTLNGIFPGTKKELYDNYNKIKERVLWLKEIGIKNIIISNTLLLDIIRKIDLDIGIEISTIAHIDTVSQIKYLNEHYNINSICNNLRLNRNAKFLENASNYCNNNNIELELIVNEFCGVGGQNYTTHCPYRDTGCYLYHSTNNTINDKKLFNEYPMNYCIYARNSDPENWIRLNWIRPEDLKLYNKKFRINKFKVTGRTGSTEYILKIVEAYMSRKWNGNLLSLWKPLETINSNENELEYKHNIVIPNKKLDGYVDYFLDNPEHDCSNEICGETCNYCHDFLKKVNII